MIKLQYNPKMAVAISREYVSSNRYYNFSYCFSRQEIIHSHTVKFMVRKNFFHLIQLNTFIQMTYTGGLIEKWKSINDAQIHRISSGIEYNHLTFDHFRGMCFIWVSLILTAFLVFLLEKYIHKKNRQPNSSRFWKIIEMTIDPYRYFMLEDKMILSNKNKTLKNRSFVKR